MFVLLQFIVKDMNEEFSTTFMPEMCRVRKLETSGCTTYNRTILDSLQKALRSSLLQNRTKKTLPAALCSRYFET